MDPDSTLLDWLYRDRGVAEIFSVRTSVALWVEVEVALARAQARLGVIPADAADAIAETAARFNVDWDELHSSTLNVGYPILPVLRQLDAQLPPHARGLVHFGATTQDIMDTALAMQLRRVCTVLAERTVAFGEALVALVERHRSLVMAARTHAQHAVPTTFGAKCATFLAELTRHLDRLDAAGRRVAVVSLFGAGGTSAALGPTASQTRAEVARELGLAASDVPWHVTRDSVVESVLVAALLAGTTIRFAREVVDLSRTEIGEVSEMTGYHRGASSTMPQKSNPIWSEACIGMGVAATSSVSAALRSVEAGHERAAGEWQIEWKVVPDAFAAAASAVRLAADIADGLDVHPERMAANLSLDNGLLLSEAYMMELARRIGRERAHDVLYDAVGRSRRNGRPLLDELREGDGQAEPRTFLAQMSPSDYLGDAELVCATALAGWRERRAAATTGAGTRP